jgi:hypothetical protein
MEPGDKNIFIKQFLKPLWKINKFIRRVEVEIKMAIYCKQPQLTVITDYNRIEQLILEA